MNGLPNEIIGAICAHLCPHCTEETESSLDDAPSKDLSRQESKITLANLCLVSSRLRAIAQPIRYHRISIQWAQTNKLVSFQRSMISRPEIASNVKQLVLDMRRDPDIDYVDGELFRLPDDWYLREEYEWPQEFSILLVFDLLTSLPCVEGMRLTLTWFQSSSASSSLTRSIPSLPRLRTLMLDCHHYRHGRFHLADLSALFQMACNLDYLGIYFCKSVCTQLPLHSVTQIILDHTRLSFADMDRLLSSCYRLKLFSYSPKRSGESVRSSEVLSLLRRYGHDKCLDTLVLHWMGYYPPSRRIGTMSGFSNLKSLELGQMTIVRLSDDVPSTFALSLPNCLELLVFKDLASSILRDLYTIRDMKSQGLLPRLKELSLVSLLEELSSITLLAEEFKALDVFCTVSRAGE